MVIWPSRPCKDSYCGSCYNIIGTHAWVISAFYDLVALATRTASIAFFIVIMSLSIETLRMVAEGGQPVRVSATVRPWHILSKATLEGRYYVRLPHLWQSYG